MASNPYKNKVQLGDGTVLMDLTADTVAADKMLYGYTAHNAAGAQVTGSIQSMAGQSVTPTRSQQTIAASGKYMTGDIVVAPIPNTYYTMEEAMALMFPVGSIYISTSSTAPTFGGTWTEVLVKQTLAEFKDGKAHYTAGSNTGNLHYWKRTA
jgi:hypothetical protein